MTLPEEYKKTDDFNPLPRPNAKRLSSRPIVDSSFLEISTYKIEFILKTEDKSYNKLEAVLKTEDKSYNKLDTMEVRPIEMDASILFYNSKNKEGPLLPISSIKDIKLVSQFSGIFHKREKTMVEISFNNRDKENKTIRINLDDKKINEFLQQIKLIQNKLHNDDAFWASYLLNVKTESGTISSIEIHPAIPFLSQGEEIVWNNIITKNVRENIKKITLLDLVTNYRIFQYNYMDHNGNFILIDKIKDIIVNNQRQKFNSLANGTYVKSGNSIHNNKETKTNNSIIGNIIISSDGKPSIIFENINDPNRLAATIKSIKKQRDFDIKNNIQSTQVNEIYSIINKYKKFNDKELSTLKLKSDNNIICGNCSKENSIDSKFCIKCGEKLNIPNRCTKCNQNNVIDAIFCNMCGNKL
ncbi:MAG TPA: zinc ribbon domain-containing protein [Candidatus Nitrosocosmicus sp.]